MQEQNADVAGGVAEQEDEVAVHHERKTRGPEPQFRTNTVRVHDGEPERGEQNREDLDIKE